MKINKILIAVVSTVLAFILCFVVTPYLARPKDMVTVIQLTSDISKGQLIEKTHIAEKQISSDAINENTVLKSEEVINTYAQIDMYKNDLINKKNTSSTMPTADISFLTKKENKMFMALTIKSLAAGLATYLEPGDIITISGTDEAKQPIKYEQLKYVKVVSVVNQYGKPINKHASDSQLKENLPSNIIVEVNQQQIDILSKIEYTSNLHLAFVYRGTIEKANHYLQMQDAIFGQ